MPQQARLFLANALYDLAILRAHRTRIFAALGAARVVHKPDASRRTERRELLAVRGELVNIIGRATRPKCDCEHERCELAPSPHAGHKPGGCNATAEHRTETFGEKQNLCAFCTFVPTVNS